MRICAGELDSVLAVDLERAGYDGSTSCYPGQTKRQFALMSLSKSLTKKYLPGASETNQSTDAAALDLFLSTNERCRGFDPLVYTTLPDWVRIGLGEAKNFLWDFFYPTYAPDDTENCEEGDRSIGCYGQKPSQPDFILSRCEIYKGIAVGPGSSIGAKSEDFYSKLSLSTLATTSTTLYSYYVEAISHLPTWVSLENKRLSHFGVQIAASSKLSFVGKTAKISRTICTEPLLNMMFQKGIARCLEDRLRQVLNIDLSSQPNRNQLLARVGSLTGEFGTIDLSSASDSMSLATVRMYFPAEVCKWLERTRSPSTVLPDGTRVELHMLSSMGNGYTFPLQTVFFAALVYGAYKALGIPLKRFSRRSTGNFAVFGDDIIVVNKAYNLVCEMLAATGFVVNVDKSFNEGLFRESCGYDSYLGHNVRGVYIKRLRDVYDCYSAINRLNRWSARHQICLPSLVGYLRKRVRYLPVPYDESDDAGIKVPSEMLPFRIRRHQDTGGIFYRYAKMTVNSVNIPADEKVSAKLPNWVYNPDGLLLACLAGSITNGRIGLRSLRDRTFKIRRRFSSRWDWISVDPGESSGYRENWKVFSVLNLS